MTSFQRESIADFSLANPYYIGASVSFYTIDAAGDKTTTRATLYSGITGSDTLANPQKLGSDGRFIQPVYVAEPVIGTVTPKNAANSHDTGVISPDLGVDAATEAQASADLAAAYTAVIQSLFDRVKSAVNSLTGITAFGRSLIEAVNAAAARTLLGIEAASDTVAGLVELATDAETATGTDTERAVTPANAASAYAPLSSLVGGNILTPHEGLVVKQVTAATVDIDATTLLLKTTAGLTYKAASVNLTVDITASGANGLDTGSEATATWYHLWVIYNGTTVAGLMSTSSTAPTMPSGYTYKGYVGAVYNDGSGNLVAFFQRGALVSQVEQKALNAGTATSYTAVNLAAYVPPTATSVFVFAGVDASSGTAITTVAMASEGSATTPTYGSLFTNTVGNPNVQQQVYGELLLTTLQQIKYFVVGTNARASIWVEGYRF